MGNTEGEAVNGCSPKCTIHGLVIYRGNEIVFSCDWGSATALAAFIQKSAEIFHEPKPRHFSVEFQCGRS